MTKPEGAIRPVLVGNWKFPRYAIALNRSPFGPRLYWTGAGDDPWSGEVSGAMRWADYGALMAAILVMGAAEPDDSPGAR